ncbi:hypothetical protein FHT21_003921 [Pedobacter sp. SG908]|nr:hypothetical protein [Pedobacter sp. SG908]NMN38272.1 hypothetical protein [Pedobacter sp. SG918]
MGKVLKINDALLNINHPALRSRSKRGESDAGKVTSLNSTTAQI